MGDRGRRDPRSHCQYSRAGPSGCRRSRAGSLACLRYQDSPFREFKARVRRPLPHGRGSAWSALDWPVFAWISHFDIAHPCPICGKIGMMPDSAMIRVIIVDDHPVVRFGLAAIIGLQPDMVVVAEAGSGEAACDIWRREAADVVLMDLRLPGLSGLDAIRT